MTTYFVTRHAGAVDWAREEGIEAVHISHLDLEIIRKGDQVLGSLPVSLVADICAKNASYHHLTLVIPPEARGKELEVEDMRKFGAKLEKFEVRRL